MHLVINCAASVEFSSRLDEALIANVISTLNLFEFSKTFKKIENFVHVSSSFVNSDKFNWIEEKIYNDFGSNPE